MTMSAVVGRVVRWGVSLGLLVLVGVLLYQSSLTTKGSEHAVSVVVPDATDVLGGQYIKAAGVNVGTVHSITAVDGGRKAKLVLYVNSKVWPLTKGTTMTVRWGGTASYVDRYINLVRGSSTTAIATDGRLPAADFRAPVEFDSFLDTFNTKTRQNLKQFLNNGGVTLKASKPGLVKTIERAPAALTQVDAVLDDLDANETALTDLVQDGSSVVSAVNASNPGVQDLIDNAATTFGALNTRTRQLASTLKIAPAAVSQLHQTLITATPVLNEAKQVTGKLSRGVTQIDEDAKPLDSVLVTLKNDAPNVNSALTSLHSATPSLNPLLTDVTALSPTLESIGAQGNTALACVRPYAPDIVAFTSDWADFLSGTTGKDHYFRAMVQSELPALDNAENYNSGQLHKDYPSATYAYPPPPGYAAGQPWYISQCNEGTNTTNPDDDPEANAGAAELPTTTTATVAGQR
jgi:ABC-type transporter Mla subunit MlaD